MLPTPVFWPGEFHGLSSPWGLQSVGHDRAIFTFTCLGADPKILKRTKERHRLVPPAELVSS